MKQSPTHKLVEAKWASYSRLHYPDLSSFKLSWLLDASSLTQRLIVASGGRFKVEVISEQWIKPMLSERNLLGMRRGTIARVRHVRLLCNDKPCVFARTVIPYSTMHGPVRRLSMLGSKSLGAVLFSDKSMRRGEIEIASISKNDYLYTQAMQNIRQRVDHLCGRRSVFYLSGKPLLVNEIFLPAINNIK